MNVHHKAHIKWPLLLLCILALSLFLVACGVGEGSSTTAATPTPAGTNYSGTGYTLTYPQGWTVNNQTVLAVSTAKFINNSDPTATVTITVTPASPLTGLSQLFTAAENTLKNNSSYQQDTTNLPSTSIGGDTWQETGGIYNDQNGVRIKGVVLADQHPSNTGSIFVITLTAKADSYDQINSTGFKPILESFKFT